MEMELIGGKIPVKKTPLTVQQAINSGLQFRSSGRVARGREARVSGARVNGDRISDGRGGKSG